jgi:hypothetical protein
MRLPALIVKSLGFVLVSAGLVCAQPAANTDRFLVIPFDNPGHEARIYWLGEASAILLADDLNALGQQAYTREERLEAFDRLQVPPVATLTHATTIRLGQLLRASHVVIGSLSLTGTQITFKARKITLDTGAFDNDVT